MAAMARTLQAASGPDYDDRLAELEAGMSLATA
jgi:hypothetical protein